MALELRARVRRWIDGVRVGGAVLCFAAGGGLVAWNLTQVPPTLARTAGRPAEVEVAGDQVPKGTDAARHAAALAERWAATEVTLDIPGEPPLVRSRSAFGASLDVSRLASRLDQALESTSLMRRDTALETIALPLPVELDESFLFERLADLKDGYDRAPVSARANLQSGELVPHEHGRTLDVHGTLRAFREGLVRGDRQIEAAVTQRPAARTVDELRGLELGHVLGSYETRYANTAESRDRSFNLGVAASKIDGTVVMPGEVFDFNALVGERSEANGFRPAPVIAGGELVDGLGGGTCQVAGTLHAAVFFAGLEVVERRPHSRPSSYIYMGLDAVVSYPQLNFRFRNDLDTPVAVGFTVSGGVARAEIRGATQERMVTFVRRVDDFTTYREREVEDASLPRGARVLSQRGVAGFTVTHWRIVRDVTTRQAHRTHGQDTYPPTTQVWRVGTGGEPPEDYRPPAGDTHGEYTADAYLEVSRGVGVRGTRTTRRAGRSGVYGWTEREGFPQPDPARFAP